jgi:TolA-binding protein
MDLLAIAAIVTAIVAVINSLSQGRKLRSDETVNIGKSYKDLIDEYQEQLRELKEEIRSLRDKAAQDRNRILGLELRLSQALERISVLEGENASLRGEDN